MILYFAGSLGKEVDQFMFENGFDRLISQYNGKKAIQDCIEKKKINDNFKLFIDSGAFSVHRLGTSLSTDEYINYINSITEYCEIFAQLDTIPGEWGKPKELEQLIEAPRLCWENYLYMAGKLKQPEKLLPIFHQGESFDWLVNMLEYVNDKGEYIPYIGLSCNKELSRKDWIKWFDKCFRIIKNSSNPNVKTHAFGMTSFKVLSKFPFTSCDSTTWIMSGANGSIMTDYGTILVSDKSRNKLQHIDNQLPEVKKNIIELVNNLGFNFEQLTKSHKDRAFYNLKYMHEKAKNLIINYNNNGKKSLI